MPFCGNCGSVVTDGAAVCPKCGATLIHVRARLPWWFWVLAVVAVLIVMVILLVLGRPG